MIFFCLLLFITQVDIDYPPDDPVKRPSGPFAPLWRGYGQYNQTDDFHRALDFHGSEGATALCPAHKDMMPAAELPAYLTCLFVPAY